MKLTAKMLKNCESINIARNFTELNYRKLDKDSNSEVCWTNIIPTKYRAYQEDKMLISIDSYSGIFPLLPKLTSAQVRTSRGISKMEELGFSYRLVELRFEWNITITVRTLMKGSETICLENIEAREEDRATKTIEEYKEITKGWYGPRKYNFIEEPKEVA